MNTGKTIRKILFAAFWLAVGCGMLLLLVAAIGKQKNETCKEVQIDISGSGADARFLTEKDVMKLLKAATKGPVQGQSRKRFDLWKIEKLLEGNMWVRDARVYFDNKDVLHVKVEQREPLARVFTAGGRSFYLDKEGQMMQLADQYRVSLPVFTGFPDKKSWNSSDSLLVNDMVKLASFINGNEFWDAQVAQTELVSNGPKFWEFEIIPVVGGHLVKLGDAQHLEEKFNRLYQFYTQVLPKAGPEKYRIVDVRFAGQIVAERKTK